MMSSVGSQSIQVPSFANLFVEECHCTIGQIGKNLEILIKICSEIANDP